MYDLFFYTTQRGESPIDIFLDAVGDKPRAKIERFMDHLRIQGPNLPRPHADILRGKIRELRVPYGRQQYRLLYFFQGKSIVLTSAFVKKTMAVSEGEISRSERRMTDWIGRYPGED